MATANIRAVISAEDKASQVLNNFGKSVEKSSKKVTSFGQTIRDNYAQIAAIGLGAGLATRKLLGVIDESIDAANKYQNALLGLSSIAKAFGHDVEDAKNAAADLAKDGLLTVADAARGLKNLLQSGFSLPQAITLMSRFKDSAAFGRQSALTFGEAVASATEGIKNGNSILVDNAGVTKNLSIILEEAGFSAQDLMRATTDANVRQALFNGIVKETNANVGDAAKLTETYAGQQARLQAQTTILKQQIGEALQPALAKLLETITPMIEKFARFAENNPKLVASVLLIVTATTALISALAALGLAIVGLGPIFKAFSAIGVISMSKVTGAVALAKGGISSLGALLRSPALLNPWTAMAAVAAGAFIKIRSEANKTIQVLNNTARAAEGAYASDVSAIQRAIKLREQGDLEGYERIMTSIRGPNRAIGGPVMAGRAYTVGESGQAETFIPHEPGSIVPNNKLSGAQTINLNINIGLYAGTEMEKRRVAQELMRAWQDASSAKGMVI